MRNQKRTLARLYSPALRKIVKRERGGAPQRTWEGGDVEREKDPNSNSD